jgi:hypothetical protein
MNFIYDLFGGNVKKFSLTDKEIIDDISGTTTLAPSTKNVYLERIATIKSIIFEKKTLIWILLHPNEFKIAIMQFGEDNNYSPSTLAQYSAVMISIITHHIELQEAYPTLLKDWKKVKRDIEKPTIDQVESNKPSDLQEKAFISYDEILKIKDKLEKGSDARLLISMYTLIPPVRSNYDRLEIFTKDPKDDENNYMVLDNEPRIVLNKYKTAKIYDKIEIPIPLNLQSEINYSLEKRPRKYLFDDIHGKPYEKPNTFNQWANRLLKRTFGNQYFSLTEFRHIYISRPDLDISNKSIAEKKLIANLMGHSVGTQARYLWK